MKMKIKFTLAGFIILCGAFFAVSETQAAVVSCVWTWPQRVTIDGTTYSCGSGRNYCNSEKAALGIGECCASAEPYQNCAPIGRVVEVNTEFSIDAWGYPGYYAWGACVNQTATREQLDAFCKSKGHMGIIGDTNACFHYGEADRWTWDGNIPMVKGNYTRAGYALTKVKCVKTYPCIENWSCGAWSACEMTYVNGQQTRTCTDANDCTTTEYKPSTSQSCCTENWTCGDWSSCVNSQKTRTCSDSNICGTTVSKPSVTQSCACAENWTCGDWSSCVNSQKTRTCTDSNICGTTASKPSVTQSCTCQENWSCGDWSSCTNSQQTKTCTDLNNCGTSSSKPTTQQACQVQCQESWSCTDWSVCQNNQQTRTCTELNNCGTTNLKPMTSQNCGNICTENWSCDEWSSCLNSKQARACVDSGKCGTSKNKPATEQNCVCAEKWVCGGWTTCQNGQQTKTCTDLNNCGTAKNKPLTKQNCQVQPEPRPPLPAPQPVPPSTETTPTAPLKTKAYIKDTKVTIENKGEGVFTIVSGDTTMTTSLEVVSSSSKPYLKTSQGLKEIKNLPEEIKAKVADKVNVINKIEIKEQNKKPLFSVSGVKKVKLLFLFPVSAKMEFQIDLEKGEIISIKKPWWSFLAKF